MLSDLAVAIFGWKWCDSYPYYSFTGSEESELVSELLFTRLLFPLQVTQSFAFLCL